MKRRNFIKTSSIAGLTVSSMGAGSHNLVSPGKKTAESGAGEQTGDFVLNEVTIGILASFIQYSLQLFQPIRIGSRQARHALVSAVQA